MSCIPHQLHGFQRLQSCTLGENQRSRVARGSQPICVKSTGTRKRRSKKHSAAGPEKSQRSNKLGKVEKGRPQQPKRGSGLRELEQANERAQSLAKKTARVANITDIELQTSFQDIRPFQELASDLRQFHRGKSEKGSSKGAGRGRGSKKELHFALLQAHKKALQAALRAELAEEESAAESRLNNCSKERLIEEGLALFGLVAESAGPLFRDVIIRLAPPVRGTLLPYHTFSHGDIVLLSGPGSLEGVVMDFSTRWIRIAVPESAADAMAKGPWRIDQYINSTAHERCIAALESFSRPSGVTEGEQALRRALLAGDTTQYLTSLAGQPPAWVKGNFSRQMSLAFQMLSRVQVLNGSQLAALKAAAERTLTLWQGPPGTGKTKTLLQLLRVLAPCLGRGKVFAGAASNVAVDNLVSGLLALGISVVRLGQPVKVLPELRAATLEAKVAQHPRGAAAATLRNKAAKLPPAAAKATREQAKALEEQATAEILSKAEVVAATCIGAGDPRLSCCDFRFCALDEATQATEPAALIPLLLRCEAAVLVGDQCQLPPTVVSQQAVAGGLGLSLFERLQAAELQPLLLDTQYRMHPVIATFPSAAFYGGRVQSFPTHADRPAPAGFPWPDKQKPIAFLDCAGPEECTTADDVATSFFNPHQAAVSLQIVHRLLKGGDLLGDLNDVAILTPYSGQVREISGRVSKMTELGKQRTAELEIRTVDGFQGREKEVMVFSTVRSNSSRSVGFLRDARRLNVALTRAKRGLMVLGNRATLSSDPTWRQWLFWIDKNGLAIDASEMKF